MPAGRSRCFVACGLVALLLAFTPRLTFAHGGGLDAVGCHHNRKVGGYHCHRGSLAGQAFASKDEALFRLGQTAKPRPRSSTQAETRTVSRVVDGDTLMLDGGERVRLIGVDTPETVHPNKPVERFGREASVFTRRMVEKKHVRLEYDQANTVSGHRDHHGRTLAYVFLEDGTLLNAEIIKQGYGHAYTRFPFRYADDFRRYEREARETGQGLWARH